MGARGYEEEAEEYEDEEEEDDGEGEYVANEEEEDDEEDEEEDRKKRKRKKASKFIDDAAEEDDDEDEEEPASKRKKRRGNSVAQFVEEFAGVDDDAEEEEDEGDAEDDFVNDDEVQASRRVASRPPLMQDDDEQLENLEQYLQHRYKPQNIEDYDDMEATEVEQKALLPSVKDPKLWMLTCQQGREREAAACLMQKYLDLAAQGQQLQILSAVAIDHLKGYIYVEAYKEAFVRQAVNGLRTVYPKNVHLVPIKEMTDVLTVERKSVDIDKENWVRVKNGLYKDDLARVISVDHVKQRAKIKLVPRIDLPSLVAKMEGREANKPKGFASRPPPRFINIQEVKELKIPVERKKDKFTRESYDQVADTIRIENGYVTKDVSLKSLNPVDSVPSLAELQKFQRPGDEDEIDALGLSTSARKKGNFVKGDTVIVTEGDLKFLMGTVEKVDEDMVEMRPKNSKLKDLLRFHTKQLSKHFNAGDHVKVISGKHEGATGMIVKVETHSVVLLSDTSKENIRVFKDSIVESSEVTSGLTRLGEFELHDLVALDQMTVGVIVRIEADGCQVLKGTPDKQEVVTVKQRDLRRRPFNRQANTQDRDMNAVSVKDIVRVVDGPFKGKQGPVEHISRGIIFIIDRHHLENGGFLCVRASSCVALGGSRGDKNVQNGYASMKPPSQYLQSPRRSPVRGNYGPPTGFGGRGGGGGGGGGGRRHETLLGRIVKVRTGPYKGYRGRVKDINDGNVRIELESQMKIVSVKRDQLAEVGDDANSSQFSKEPSRYGAGSETPMHPSRTPLHPSMTPMRDITATPMHEGMRTPMRDRAWNPFATPLRDPNDDGGWGTSVSPPYMQQPGTPLASRTYEAPTPGSGWSPGVSYSDSGSPVEHAYVPGTPSIGALPMTPAAPSCLPGTPGGQPMTPGDPTSPTAYNMHEVERQWALPEVIITLRRHGESHIGVIQDILPDGLCRITLGLANDGETVTASQSEMEMVPTRKNDRVKIVSGEFRGCSGRLIGIDGGEGIVRVDNQDVKILEMSALGKKYERNSVSSS